MSLKLSIKLKNIKIYFGRLTGPSGTFHSRFYTNTPSLC